jgi:hypothetical protein
VPSTDTALLNLYGQTEASGDCTFHVCCADDAKIGELSCRSIVCRCEPLPLMHRLMLIAEEASGIVPIGALCQSLSPCRE